MSSIAILGSGFGLYGYLPALVACGQSIVLPERYRKRFDDRIELKPFANRVQWAHDELSALGAATGVVLALAPSIQSKWLAICLEQPQLRYLFLEKPLATNPLSASMMHSSLQLSDKVVRIAYVFRFLDWASQLACHFSGDRSNVLRLSWRFKAHHFRNDLPTWKREHEQGGGPLRFYGIHVVALLAEFGYTTVIRSSTSTPNLSSHSRWRATFAGNRLPDFEVEIDTASQANEFSIVSETTRKSTTLIHQSSPFANGPTPDQAGSIDGRVGTLTNFCQSAWKEADPMPTFYGRAIELWNELEHVESHCNSVRSAA